MRFPISKYHPFVGLDLLSKPEGVDDFQLDLVLQEYEKIDISLPLVISSVTTEDVKLSLEAYYQDLENLKTDLQIREYAKENLPLNLVASFWNTEDIKLSLSIFYQEMKDFTMDLLLWANSVDDFELNLVAFYQSFTDHILTDLELWANSADDINMALVAASWDVHDVSIPLDICATDYQFLKLFAEIQAQSKINFSTNLEISLGLILLDLLLICQITDGAVIQDFSLQLQINPIYQNFKSVYAMHLRSNVVENI